MSETLSQAPLGMIVATATAFQPANDLVAYWRSKRGERIAPSRRDIDPIEIPRRLLPHVFMFDVVEGGADFRYRLIGTDIVGGVGRDSTGSTISELYRNFPEALDGLNRTMRRIMVEHNPLFLAGTLFWVPRRQMEKFESVFLPLSSDGMSVDIILGGFWGGAERPVRR